VALACWTRPRCDHALLASKHPSQLPKTSVSTNIRSLHFKLDLCYCYGEACLLLDSCCQQRIADMNTECSRLVLMLSSCHCFQFQALITIIWSIQKLHHYPSCFQLSIPAFRRHETHLSGQSYCPSTTGNHLCTFNARLCRCDDGLEPQRNQTVIEPQLDAVLEELHVRTASSEEPPYQCFGKRLRI